MAFIDWLKSMLGDDDLPEPEPPPESTPEPEFPDAKPFALPEPERADAKPFALPEPERADAKPFALPDSYWPADTHRAESALGQSMRESLPHRQEVSNDLPEPKQGGEDEVLRILREVQQAVREIKEQLQDGVGTWQ